MVSALYGNDLEIFSEPCGFFGIIFLIRCTADFFLFSRGLGRKRSADFWFFAAAEKIFALNLR